MNALLRIVRAVAVVATSMAAGVLLTFGYFAFGQPVSEGPIAWLAQLTPSLARGVVPVRLEAPLSRDGVASKASLFDEEQITSIYRQVAPAVVLIRSRVGQRAGLGSGVIIDPKGVVLTNNHVIRNATQIEVALSDRTSYVGEVLGRDPQNDLAVIRLVDAPETLPSAPLGDSEALSPGSLALAIGNPHGMERSVTVGVVSGLNRTLRDTPARAPIRDVIQTDAAINQGNSGGPLLNSRGEVIGITTAIEVVNGQQGFGGIGYAVPIATAKRHLEQLLNGAVVEHAWLGISGGDVTPAAVRERGLAVPQGILVAETVSAGPAEEGGVRAGDVITAIGGYTLRSMDELGLRLDRAHRPGETVKLTVARGKERLELDITLGKWPERLPPQR